MSFKHKKTFLVFGSLYKQFCKKKNTINKNMFFSDSYIHIQFFFCDIIDGKDVCHFFREIFTECFLINV